MRSQKQRKVEMSSGGLHPAVDGQRLGEIIANTLLLYCISCYLLQERTSPGSPIHDFH